MWSTLVTPEDADHLTELFGRFHDSCLREIYIWAESSVGDDFTMTCNAHLDSHVRIYFQRQSAAPSAIELQFDEVIGLQLLPTSENCDSIILGAKISFENGVFYWRQEASDRGNWIGGKKLKWRDVSFWMGSEMRYGQKS